LGIPVDFYRPYTSYTSVVRRKKSDCITFLNLQTKNKLLKKAKETEILKLGLPDRNLKYKPTNKMRIESRIEQLKKYLI
jgi:hypothetical protein